MLKSEPVAVLLGGLASCVAVVLGALVAVDVIAWTPTQVAAVVASIGAVTALAVAVIRAAVVSPETSAARVDAARVGDAPW